MNEYIALSDCVERKLYRLDARNIKIGVFNNEKGFIGIRSKFGRRFLDVENHWDMASFASAKPIEVIGELPNNICCDRSSNELFDWLEKQEREHGNAI